MLASRLGALYVKPSKMAAPLAELPFTGELHGESSGACGHGYPQPRMQGAFETSAILQAQTGPSTDDVLAEKKYE